MRHILYSKYILQKRRVSKNVLYCPSKNLARFNAKKLSMLFFTFMGGVDCLVSIYQKLLIKKKSINLS